MQKIKKMQTIVLFLCSVLLCLQCSISVFARTPGHVFDDAGLFSEQEASQLETQAQQIGDTWDMDVLIVTTNDTQGLSAREYGIQFFLDGGFGYGATSDGIVFVIDMGGREAQMVTSGLAVDIFTDYYIDVIWEEVSSYLSDGAYYDGMTAFMGNVSYYLGEYQKYLNDPEYVSQYEHEKEDDSSFVWALAAVPIAAVLAAVVVWLLRRGHNNVRPFTDGQAYLKENGVHIYQNNDRFVNTFTTRTKIAKDDDHDDHDDHSWGGSSSSSGGFGGGGGKF